VLGKRSKVAFCKDFGVVRAASSVAYFRVMSEPVDTLSNVMPERNAAPAGSGDRKARSADRRDGEPAAAAPEAFGTLPVEASVLPREIGGRQGPEPTRFGDWEKSGRCIDF
jgi:hypothetical protein